MKTLNAFAQLVVLVSLPLLLGGCSGEKPVAEVKLEPESKPEPEPQGVNFLDLNFVGDGRFAGDVILKETGENYTGKAYSTYANGRKMEEVTYKDGYLSGIWIRYHENGKKHSEGNYKDGKKDGLWQEWRQDGTWLRDQFWKDGQGGITK